MESEQWQVTRSARRIVHAIENELVKLGPSGRRALLCGLHEGLAQRIAEADKATRAEQQRTMQRRQKQLAEALIRKQLTPDKEPRLK
jgi:hypothetical protein